MIFIMKFIKIRDLRSEYRVVLECEVIVAYPRWLALAARACALVGRR